LNREATPIRDRIKNRRVHREELPIRGKEIAGLLALAALVALPVVFGLLQDNEVVRTRFAIESLRREKLVLQERYRRLRIEKATLEALGRVETEARKLGLVPPGEGLGVVFGPAAARPGGAVLARSAEAARGAPEAAIAPASPPPGAPFAAALRASTTLISPRSGRDR